MRFLEQVKQVGLAGVQNFPTVGLIDGNFRANLEECVPVIDGIVRTAKSIRKEVIVLCHGGPIAEPDDAAFILKNCQDVDGFYGASSMERLPTERAIKEQTAKFTQIRRS